MPGIASEKRPPPDDGATEAARRLALYRRVAGALGAFFRRRTALFCAHCLEVTRRHHRDDPRADVDLLEGTFPGCCHAGVAEALWVPRFGEEGRFSSDLAEAMNRARLPAGPAEPLAYRVRERRTGLVARGVACRYLGPEGCRLGDLRSPLCVAYLCEPVREAIAAAAGSDLLGSDTDDFCGALEALGAAVARARADGEARLGELEVRLAVLGERLDRWEEASGATLYGSYSSSQNETNPSVSIR